MKLDNNKDLVIKIEAKIVWISPPKDIAQQIIRETINHRIKAMGNKLEYSVATIIKSISKGLEDGN